MSLFFQTLGKFELELFGTLRPEQRFQDLVHRIGVER